MRWLSWSSSSSRRAACPKLVRSCGSLTSSKPKPSLMLFCVMTVARCCSALNDERGALKVVSGCPHYVDAAGKASVQTGHGAALGAVRAGRVQQLHVRSDVLCGQRYASAVVQGSHRQRPGRVARDRIGCRAQRVQSWQARRGRRTRPGSLEVPGGEKDFRRQSLNVCGGSVAGHGQQLRVLVSTGKLAAVDD